MAKTTNQTAEILKPFGEYATPGLQPGVIKTLKKWLEMAERGELIAVAMAGCTSNGSVTTNYNSGNASGFLLIGSVDHLKHQMNEEMNKP